MKQEVNRGEMKDSQDVAILQSVTDVRKLKRGTRAECKSIWAEAET